MGSRARLGAATLLALLAITGVGTAGADPLPDPAAGDEGRDSLSERRNAARTPGHQRDEPRPRCHRREHDCGIGLPDHDDLESSSDGGWPNTVLPDWTFQPPQAPPRIPPPLSEPVAPDIVDVVPGVSIPVTAPVGAPIAVPVLPVVPGVVAPGPGAGAAPRPQTPPERPAAPAPRAPRAPEPPPAVNNSPASAATHRTGYPDYLRGAGLPQIAAVALPGVAGILVLTGAGGLVGYRQAKAGRAIAVRPATRFMN